MGEVHTFSHGTDICDLKTNHISTAPPRGPLRPGLCSHSECADDESNSIAARPPSCGLVHVVFTRLGIVMVVESEGGYDTALGPVSAWTKPALAGERVKRSRGARSGSLNMINPCDVLARADHSNSTHIQTTAHYNSQSLTCEQESGTSYGQDTNAAPIQ